MKKKSKALTVRSRTQTKALTFTPQNATWNFFPGSRVDFASEVNNGMQSSVVTSALCWMMSTFPEAPLVVQREREELWDKVVGHPLAKLLRRPNREYGGVVLWQATIMDFCFGEAFWLKIRNGEGKVVELWWIPRALITPIASKIDGGLDHYEYRPGYTSLIILQPEDVVHFRFGKDPNNILRGFSPLAAVMREVYTDDQAANFTAAILKNYGVIGVILAPDQGMIPRDKVLELKEDVQKNFTGDKRGSAMIFSGPMKAQVLQYNLTGFDISPVRDIAEERVTAALGIPAAVIGFGTGLQQTKVGATMREMVKLAWQGGIEPKQRSMVSELDRALLPDFQENPDLFRTHFDLSEVEALTETPMEKTERVLKLIDKNVIKVTQAQRELGYPVDSTQDKYLRELAPATPAPVNTPALPDPAVPDPAANKGIHTTINIPEIPVSIALRLQSPKAGETKTEIIEMEKGADNIFRGKKVTTTLAPVDEPIEEPHTNGDAT